MTTPHAFTLPVVEKLGRDLGVAFDKFTPVDLQIGMDVELEHGTAAGPMFNVTNDDPRQTAMIALAHLAERGDYYKRLPVVEGESGIILFWNELIILAILLFVIILLAYFWFRATPTSASNATSQS